MTNQTPTQTPTRTVTVLIVDDVAQVRRSLRTLLSLVEGIQVVGEAGDGQAALRQAAALHPGVVLMDLEMPVMDGFAATRAIKSSQPECRVVTLSVHTYDAARKEAEQAGADDFVEKGAPIETLLRAIRDRG